MRMVLAFLGIIKTEEEITQVCDTTELGTTPTQISEGNDDEIEYHDPDEPDGKYLKCDFEAFISAWNASRCWMIKLEKE